MNTNKQDLSIPGPVGNIETLLQLPLNTATRVGIICHPNPLQGGTMQNKVVTTIARTLNAMGIAAVTFNYRGVGQSAGSYGNIDGEVDDCLAIVKWVKQEWPQAQLWLAGFSFGAYIAAAVATQIATERLISIAPSVDRMPYSALAPVSCPWLVIQGEEDEVVNPESVYSWFKGLVADKTLIRMPGTGHFFHGKLVELQQIIQLQVNLLTE